MSELIINLPENLYQKLTTLATESGFPLNQYITYLLSQQINSSENIQKISEIAIAQQQKFTQLLEELGETSQEEAEIILNSRERVAPDNGLTPEIIAHFQQRIQNHKNC